MPPKIISFYLIRHYLVWLAIVALVFSVFVLMGDLLETNRLAAKINQGYMTALFYSLLRVPSLVSETLPFIILFATMICLLRLAESRELIIVRMGGLSVWQFLSPMLLLAAFVGIIEVILFDPAATTGLRTYQNINAPQVPRPQFVFSESGIWLHENDDEGSRILRAQYISTRNNQAVLGETSFLLLDVQDNYLYRIEADIARLHERRWELTNAQIIRPGEQIVRHTNWQLPTSLSVDDLNHYYRPATSLTLWQLPAYIDAAKGKGADTKSHIVRFHKLLATPATYMAMVLLAACFSLPTTRVLSSPRIIGFTILSGIAFYLFSTFALKLAETNLLPPLPAAWLPPLIAALVGVSLLLESEDA